MFTLALIALLISAYFLGSVPFAIVTSRLLGLRDPRSYGSGNPGATNVLRSGNKTAAALTLAGDCFKGWLAVGIARALGFSPELAALAGLAAFIGHVFSFFLHFNGGKGVATALGVLIGIAPLAALFSFGSWLLVALVSRYSSAAAIAAAITAPVVIYLNTYNPPLALTMLVISGMLIWRHTLNIQRLLAGTEEKIGQRRADAEDVEDVEDVEE
jgi:glycerol-3-phosphate acyltransferase PlsY